MKNRKKLWLVLSSIFLVVGLASCGANGAKGDTGNNGTNGTNGTDGKDGTNGKDGSTMLTGTTDPLSSLGNDGDVYLNSTTYDLFKKVDGVWTKIGNIKGQDGKDGKDGKAGNNGDEAETTYSSTILSCDHGYVTVNKGSAKVGEAITFTFVADSTYKVDYFKVNDETFASTKLTNNTYTTTMISGGFVISANFILSSAKTNVITTAQELETALASAADGTVLTLIASTNVALTGVNIDKEGVTVNITHNGSGSVDLNGVEISGTGATLVLEDSITNVIANTSPIIISGEGVTINGNGATLTGDNPIKVTDETGTSKINNVVINKTNNGNSGSSYSGGNLFNGITTKGVGVDNSASFVNVAIRVSEGANIELENVTIGAGFDAAIYASGDNLTTGKINIIKLKKCTITAGKYKGIYAGNVNTLDIQECTFEGTNVKASQTTDLAKALKQTGSLIDISQRNEDGRTVNISNNTFKNLTDNGIISGAILIKTINDGAFTGVTISGNTFTNNIRDIVIGNDGDDDSINFGTNPSIQDAQTVNGTATKIKFYDNAGSYKDPTLTKYIFENGQYYGYEDANSIDKKHIIPDIKFDSGDGTINNPLIIKDVDEFLILGNETFLNTFITDDDTIDTEFASIHVDLNKKYYYKLGDDIDLTSESSIGTIMLFSGILDGNGKTLTYNSQNINPTTIDESDDTYLGYWGLFDGFNGTIKNLTINYLDNGDSEETMPMCGLFYRSINGSTCSFEDITIESLDSDGDVGIARNFSQNDSLLISYSYSSLLTFKNIINNAEIIGTGNISPFLGGYLGTFGEIDNAENYGKVVFDGCINNGDITMSEETGEPDPCIGILIGNADYSAYYVADAETLAKHIVVKNCKNAGTLTANIGNVSLICGDASGEIRKLFDSLIADGFILTKHTAKDFTTSIAMMIDTFADKFYNKYNQGDTPSVPDDLANEQAKAYWIEIGDISVDSISNIIVDNDTFTSEDIGTSIGNSVYIHTSPWHISGGKLYVAISILATLSGKVTIVAGSSDRYDITLPSYGLSLSVEGTDASNSYGTISIDKTGDIPVVTLTTTNFSTYANVKLEDNNGPVVGKDKLIFRHKQGTLSYGFTKGEDATHTYAPYLATTYSGDVTAATAVTNTYIYDLYVVGYGKITIKFVGIFKPAD